jgi:proteasome lid subunit RPN8/RPN11
MINKKDESKNGSQKKKTEVKANYPIVLGQDKGRLTLSKELIEQIDTLHNYVGAKEWSGPVLFSINAGDINTPTELDVTAHAMYPMNIGTAAYTEYDFEPEETFDMHDYYPQIMEEGWRMGHMHTHHNMKAYFSGTDNQELQDNTQNHAYYLSLIVNFEGKYVARLCVMAKKEITGNSGIKYQNIEGKDTISNFKITQEQDVVYAIDLDVVYDKQGVSGFMGEVLKIAEREDVRKKERAAKSKSKFTQSSLWETASKSSWTGGYDNHLGSYNNSWMNPTIEEEEELSDLAKEFCMLIITGGSQAVGYFPTQMEKADLEWHTADEDEQELFIAHIDENFNEWYQKIFKDPQMEDFEDNLDAVMEEFYKHTGVHPLADILIAHLEQYSVLTQ